MRDGPISTWPGEDKRRPRRSSWNWSLRGPLSVWLEQEGKGAAGLRVLDVGCGEKPYLPFFATALEYVGVDVVQNPVADLQGPVESLPVDDASFDLVLCIQVFEHADNPARAVRELHRVVKPGGRVLVSTHGTYVYHPAPVDYWRWTHTGLERLFTTNAGWRSISVSPGAGTAACLGMLFALFVEHAFERLHAAWAARIATGAVNTVAAAADRRSRLLREAVPGSLIANFHLVAER